MHELPLLTKKVDGNEVTALCSGQPITNAAQSESDKYFLDMDSQKNEQLLLLMEYTSGDEILRALAATPASLDDAFFLEHALDHLVGLEDKEKLTAYDCHSADYRQMIVQLAQHANPQGLIRSLENFHTRPYMKWTIDHICNEILLRSADNRLSVYDICDAIHNIAECGRQMEAEKFWSALANVERDINEHNICIIFAILPRLRVSRRIVVSTLYRCFADLYRNMSFGSIVNILHSLDECKYGYPVRILSNISSWLRVHIEDMDEVSLERVVHYLTKLNYTDKDVVDALEYFIVKTAVRITYQPLIEETLRHMRKFRIVNARILNGCSEYLVQNIDHIDPKHFDDIVCPFGELYFRPLNWSSFWQAVEAYTYEHFDEMQSDAVIDIMLSAVYLQAFPTNLTGRVFSKRFMQPLQLYKSGKLIAKRREKLKLLDAAIALESSPHRGPFLPRQMVGERFVFENRVKCILNDNIDVIKMIAGGETSFTLTTIPYQLPYNSLYTIDILFHPAGWNLLLSYNKLKDRNTFVAALIHLPEHYDSSQTLLLGEQQMRIRHLRKIGFKVVSLQYSMLAKLSIHRKELYDYYVQQMRTALPALDAKA